MNEGWARSFARLGKAILTNLGVLLLLMLVFSAFTRDWTLGGFSNAAFWSGTLGILVAIFSLAGGWMSTRSVPYQYGSSAGEEDLHTRARQARDTTAGNASFLIRMGAAGLIMLILSEILTTF